MAQDLGSKKQGFMARYVAAAQKLMDSRDALRALKAEWDALAYSTAIVQGDITSGSLLHLTPTILANGFNSQIALEALLNNQVPTQGNHITNIESLLG